MLKKIKIWWAFRRMTTARQAVLQWEDNSNRMLKQLQRRIRKLEALNKIVKSLTETVLEDLEDSEKVIKQHAHALDSIRSEYDVLKETTLPVLVSENRAIRERWDAEIATARRRKVHMSEGEDSFD